MDSLSNMFIGIASGLPLVAYLKTGRLTIPTLFYFSSYFAVTLKFYFCRTSSFTKNLWFQILCIERLSLCNPYGAFLLRFALFCNFYYPYRQFLTYYIPVVSGLAQFLQYYIFSYDNSIMYLFYSLLALVFHLALLKWLKIRFILSVAFYYILALSIYHENTRKRCWLIPFYNPWYDILLYLSLHFQRKEF